MDFTQILIAGALGALFGALGAAAGAIVAKRLPSQFQAIVIAVLVVAGIGASRFAHEEVKQRSLKAELHQQMQQNDMFSFLASEFPDEYDGYLTSLSKLRSEDVAFKLGAQFTSSLRKKYADSIRSASSENLVEYYRLDRELTAEIRRRDGDYACTQFLLVGPTQLANNGSEYNVLMSQRGDALFQAIANGRTGNGLYPSPTEEDWSRFFAHWRVEGATDEMINMTLAPQGAGAEFCDIYLSFIAAVLSWDDSAADPIRSELMYQQAVSE